MGLRIIAGKYRRRILKTPEGQSTRPYTDRVRQIVFDRLGDELIENARVADIFSGVGTMGMESLSRGAATCVFYEFDFEVFSLLKGNVHAIAPDARTVCWKADIRRTSFRPQNAEDCLPYSLLFFDPPYAMVNQMKRGKPLYESLRRLARESITTPDADLLLRTPDDQEFEGHAEWATAERWDLSTMTIWRLRKTASAAAFAEAEAAAEAACESGIDEFDDDEFDDESADANDGSGAL